MDEMQRSSNTALDQQEEGQQQPSSSLSPIRNPPVPSPSPPTSPPPPHATSSRAHLRRAAAKRPVLDVDEDSSEDSLGELEYLVTADPPGKETRKRQRTSSSTAGPSQPRKKIVTKTASRRQRADVDGGLGLLVKAVGSDAVRPAHPSTVPVLLRKGKGKESVSSEMQDLVKKLMMCDDLDPSLADKLVEVDVQTGLTMAGDLIDPLDYARMRMACEAFGRSKKKRIKLLWYRDEELSRRYDQFKKDFPGPKHARLELMCFSGSFEHNVESIMGSAVQASGKDMDDLGGGGSAYPMGVCMAGIGNGALLGPMKPGETRVVAIRMALGKHTSRPKKLGSILKDETPSHNTFDGRAAEDGRVVVLTNDAQVLPAYVLEFSEGGDA